METMGLGLKVVRPASMLTKPLKADGKGLFKALTKGAAHAGTGKWAELLPDIGEMVTALGLKTEPEELAWLLIRRALTQALSEFVDENIDLDVKALNYVIDDELDQALEQTEWILDPEFFVHPGATPLLEQIKIPFETWLIKHQLEPARARTVIERLPAYFVYALHHEWRQNAQVYKSIQEAFTSPFSAAVEQEQAWVVYRDKLQKQVQESIFQETFSLSQVYIPLRAYWEKEVKGINPDRTMHHDKKGVRVVVDLAEEIDAWLARADKSDAIRVISGGPGSGKSSFCKMLAARLATQGHKILFIPLHLFDPKGDLVSAVGAYVKSEGILSSNPLDSDTNDSNVILCFDGLDELAMQGKAAQEVAQQFVREVEKTFGQRNYHGLHLQAILSGRELIVQANANEFKRDGQILHVLPYYQTNGEIENGNYEDKEGRLDADLRTVWWQKYGAATGKGYQELPKPLSRPELEEITAQPLLNYLVALSYDRQELVFTEQTNLNQVYADLLESVYKRVWGMPHPTVRGMNQEQFEQVLEEIGLAIWHGNGRTTTVREIQEHCTSASIAPLLEVFQEGAEAGVTRLLTAFYFRQHGNNATGERTFEFTHKSFGEYLTARRVVRGLTLMQEETQRRKQKHYSGWSDQDALKHWAEWCGPSAIDHYLFRFLKDEISLLKVDSVRQWQLLLIELIEFMLRNGMPMEHLSPRLNYLDETRQARNAEEALLVTLNACARLTQQISHVQWPEPNAAGAWLVRLRGQRIAAGNTLALSCLGYLRINGILHLIDLYNAEMPWADLTGAELHWALLGPVNLTGANLTGANLSGAKLVTAKLSRAKLNRVILTHADLTHADLTHADLTGADLTGADLTGADLTGADLTDAKMTDVKLNRARVIKARANKAKVNKAEMAVVKGLEATDGLGPNNLQDRSLEHDPLEQ
jgi:hypothetical protein